MTQVLARAECVCGCGHTTNFKKNKSGRTIRNILRQSGHVTFLNRNKAGRYNYMHSVCLSRETKTLNAGKIKELIMHLELVHGKIET